MTNQSGNKQEREDYISGWTEMMITIWREKMQAYNIHPYNTNGENSNRSPELYNSFTKDLRKAGNDTASIRHQFNSYAFYVERGHGRGRTANNKLGKPFLSKHFFRSVYALSGFMSENYAREGMNILMTTLDTTK